jgi:Holliday junction resolvase-like predicted endonuclease
MTIRDDIVRFLRENPEGLTDGELATRLGKLHQQVNQRCRQLAHEGHVRRDDSFGTIRNVLVSSPSARPAPVPPPVGGSIHDDPRWEGNVQDAIVAHLASEGWTIVSAADTASQARGIDIIAERDRRRFLIEVKGYPGTTYARGEKAGQPKPTQPTLQAKHWLSDALLKTMRTREKHPEAQVAIGLPDMPRYRTLLCEIAGSLVALDVHVLLVHDDRTVTTWRTDHAPA